MASACLSINVCVDMINEHSYIDSNRRALVSQSSKLPRGVLELENVPQKL